MQEDEEKTKVLNIMKHLFKKHLKIYWIFKKRFRLKKIKDCHVTLSKNGLKKWDKNSWKRVESKLSRLIADFK